MARQFPDPGSKAPGSSAGRIAVTLVVALASAAVYGFVHEHLFAEPFWSDSGRVAFLEYAGVFWAIAAALIAFTPRWIVHVIAALMLLYTVWWSGVVAPLAV